MSYIFPGIPLAYVKTAHLEDLCITTAKLAALAVTDAKIAAMAGSKLTGNAPANFVTDAGIVSMDGTKLTNELTAGIVDIVGTFIDNDTANEYSTNATSYTTVFQSVVIFIPRSANNMQFYGNVRVSAGTGQMRLVMDTETDDSGTFTNTSYAYNASITTDVSSFQGTYKSFYVQLKGTGGAYSYLKGFTIKFT